MNLHMRVAKWAPPNEQALYIFYSACSRGVSNSRSLRDPEPRRSQKSACCSREQTLSGLGPPSSNSVWAGLPSRSSRRHQVSLFEPRRRQPCGGPPSPRQAGRRIRVGLPAQDQRQRTSCRIKVGLPSNSGQTLEGDTRSLAAMLASEHSSRSLPAASRCRRTTARRLDLSTSYISTGTSHKGERPDSTRKGDRFPTPTFC